MNVLFTKLLYFKAKIRVISILGYPMQVFVSWSILNIPWLCSSLSQMLKFLLQDRWICMRTCMFEMLLGRVKNGAGDCTDHNLWAMFFNFTQILLWVSVLYWDLPSVVYIRSHHHQGLPSLVPVSAYWMGVLPKGSSDRLAETPEVERASMTFLWRTCDFFLLCISVHI